MGGDADRAVLAKIRRKSLAWIGRNLRHFRRLGKGEELSLDGLRALAEALLLPEVAVAARPALSRHPVLARLRGIGVEAWNDERFLERAVRRPDGFRLSFSVLASLVACGMKASREDRLLLRQVMERGYVTGILEIAFHQMERETLLRTLSWPGSANRRLLRRLVARSPIGSRVPPLEMRQSEVYNLTHLVFYLTDWGRKASPVPSVADHAYVRWATRLLLPVWSAYEDWDVVAELLIVACCLGLRKDPIVRRALRELAAAQRADGSFPSPYTESREFLSVYHNVVIAALLGITSEFDPAVRGEIAEHRVPAKAYERMRAALRSALIRHERWLARASASAKDERASVACETRIRAIRKLLPRCGPPAATSHSANGDVRVVSALLRAVASYDLTTVGRQLEKYVRSVGPDALAFEVVSWVLARQDRNGALGSPPPDLPASAALLDGLAAFVAAHAPHDDALR